MDREMWVLGAALVLILGSVTMVVFYRLKMTALLQKLAGMLDAAIMGEFEETVYDESRMSALEIRLKQYLKKQSWQERQLKREEENIHALISDISHQTKTPLANLVLYAQLLKEQELSTEARPLAEQLSSQAEKLQFLIGSLIKASRLENGIISLNPEMNSVRELLSRVTAEAGQKAAQREIQIEWRPEEDEVYAFFDKKWTAEAVYNILDNAVKYTHKGDTIKVEGCAYELFYRINVTDHGIGIREEEYPKIFRRFYRSEEVAKEEGVGLGLYLAREIVTAQGGYLKVSSGKETVFSIFLSRTQTP